jgi:hypothetical protein
MLPRLAPAHLLAGTLLWAACGRIGYQELNGTGLEKAPVQPAARVPFPSGRLVAR